MKDKWKKIRLPFLTILIVLLIDQCIKFYVKLHFAEGDNYPEAAQGVNRFEILFIENRGMAFGYEIWGEYGKLILSIFRIVAAIFGVFYIRHIIRKKEHWGYIFSVALIFAGAVGNILDSAFYGLIFSSSEGQVATLFPEGGGYESFLYGKVVDMFHFPFWRGTFPDWFPIWGGESFEFFSPIFNFADASISAGVILIFLFQRRFFKKHREERDAALQQQNESAEITENNSLATEQEQVVNEHHTEVSGNEELNKQATEEKKDEKPPL